VSMTGTTVGTRGLVSTTEGVSISTAGLVDYTPFPATPWSDVMDDVSDYLEAARAASRRFRSALETGAPTTQQLRRICADRDGLAEDAKSIRAVMDATEAADYLLYTDPAKLIRLWQAKRSVRRALVRSEAGLRALCDVADELREGEVQREHVVIEGETYQSIAQRYYGDHREWRKLQAANGIEPADLTAGTVLTIPRG